MTFLATPKFVYGDPIGLGNWLLAHYLEHVEFNSTLQDVPETISDFPIQRMEDPKRWLEVHQRMHQTIWTAIGGGTATDLSLVDWSKDDDVQDWLDTHAAVHAQIRVSLGI